MRIADQIRSFFTQQQNVQAQQQPQQQGPIQFSRPEGFASLCFTSLKNKIMNTPPHKGPDATFTLGRSGLRGATTNNLAGVRDMVFGKAADRQAVPSQHVLKHRIGLAMPNQNANARTDANLQVPLGGNKHLSGFSVSASPNSPVLDTNKPVVLFLSGSGGSAEKYGTTIAGRYAGQHDCNFVALNYQGYGQSSDKSPSEKSITKDGFAMINHLLQLGFQPDQIVVHGYSMGASVASRLQASVESRGYTLGGVVYDRPMSSATGAAKGVAEEEGGTKNDANFNAFGTKLTVGSLSTRRNLEDIVSSNGQLRSPTVLVSDTGSFGARSDQMGKDLGIAHNAATGGDHEDHALAMDAIAQQGQLAGIL